MRQLASCFPYLLVAHGNLYMPFKLCNFCEGIRFCGFALFRISARLAKNLWEVGDRP